MGAEELRRIRGNVIELPCRHLGRDTRRWLEQRRREQRQQKTIAWAMIGVAAVALVGLLFRFGVL